MRRRNLPALGESPEPSLATLTIPSVAEAARGDTERAGYPSHSGELQTGEEERARSSVRSAAPLAPDPEKSVRDRIARSEVERLSARLETLRARERDLEAERDEAARKQAALRAPLSGVSHACVIAFNLAFSALTALVAGGLLTTTLDELLRGWANGIAGGGGARFSATVAFALGSGLSGVLCLGQTKSVIGAHGRPSGTLKALLFASDLMVAAAFGAMRYARHPGLEALGFSLAELALLLAHTGVVLAFAKLYALQACESEAYRPAKAVTDAARVALKRCIAAIAETRAALGTELGALGGREDAARYAELRGDLAAETARVEHLTTSAQLAGKHAKSPSEQSLAAAVETHFADLLKGKERTA